MADRIEELFALFPPRYKVLQVYRHDDGNFGFSASSNNRRQPLRCSGRGATMEHAIVEALGSIGIVAPIRLGSFYFGPRANPCDDCVEGYCTMNCGPRIEVDRPANKDAFMQSEGKPFWPERRPGYAPAMTEEEFEKKEIK